MKLASIISAQERAILDRVRGVKPHKPVPAKGKLPAALLQFNAQVDANRTEKELRRWLHGEFKGTLIDIPVTAHKIVQDARKRVLIFKETPRQAVVKAATCHVAAKCDPAVLDPRLITDSVNEAVGSKMGTTHV